MGQNAHLLVHQCLENNSPKTTLETKQCHFFHITCLMIYTELSLNVYVEEKSITCFIIMPIAYKPTLDLILTLLNSIIFCNQIDIVYKLYHISVWISTFDKNFKINKKLSVTFNEGLFGFISKHTKDVIKHLNEPNLISIAIEKNAVQSKSAHGNWILRQCHQNRL